MPRGALPPLLAHVPAQESHVLAPSLPPQVWRPDAVVEIKADLQSPPLQLPPPATRYFRGRWAAAQHSTLLASCGALFAAMQLAWLMVAAAPCRCCSIAGEPNSVAVLSVREDGGVSGLALRGNASWAIGRPGADQAPAAGSGAPPMTTPPLSSKKARASAASVRQPFTCANDGLNFGGLGLLNGSAEEPAGSRKLMQVRWVGASRAAQLLLRLAGNTTIDRWRALLTGTACCRQRCPARCPLMLLPQTYSCMLPFPLHIRSPLWTSSTKPQSPLKRMENIGTCSRIGRRR